MIILLLFLSALGGFSEAKSQSYYMDEYVTKLRERFEFFKQLVLEDRESRQDSPDYPTQITPMCEAPAEMTCDVVDGEPGSSCCTDIDSACSTTHTGFCKLLWQLSTKCDFYDRTLCGEGCTCCISCGRDVISTCRENSGNCSATCPIYTADVSTDFPCHSDLCRCCKPCEDNGCSALGKGSRCVGSPELCDTGHFLTEGVCGTGSCICCSPCVATEACVTNRGYAERLDIDCMKGYEPSMDGCQSSGCKCCVPEKTNEGACQRAAGAIMGLSDRCTPREKCPPNYRQVFEGCFSPKGKECFACLADGWDRCRITQNCTDLGGYCARRCKNTDEYYADDRFCTSSDVRTCQCCIPRCKVFDNLV